MCLGLSFGGLTDLKSTINKKKKKFCPEMEAYPDTSLSKIALFMSVVFC